MAEATPGIRAQQIYPTPLCRGEQPVDTVDRGQIGFHRLHADTMLPARWASSKPMPVEAPVTIANLSAISCLLFGGGHQAGTTVSCRANVSALTRFRAPGS